MPWWSASLPICSACKSGFTSTLDRTLQPRSSLRKTNFYPSFPPSSTKKLVPHEGEMQMSPLSKESTNQIWRVWIHIHRISLSRGLHSYLLVPMCNTTQQPQICHSPRLLAPPPTQRIPVWSSSYIGEFDLLASLEIITNYLHGIKSRNNLYSSSFPLLHLRKTLHKIQATHSSRINLFSMYYVYLP